MQTFKLLRNKTIDNCKEICKVMKQSEDLYKEKYNAIVRYVELEIGEDQIPFKSPESFYLKCYNRSIELLTSLRIRSIK